MFSKLLASATFASIALASVGSAQAMPAFGPTVSTANAGVVEHVGWRRDHDRDGRWGLHRVCDRDGDRCYWVRGWR